MIKFIALQGKFVGSARLKIENGRTEICVKLKGTCAKKTFITDGKRISSIILNNGCGVEKGMEVTGIILCNENDDLIAFGSTQMSDAEMEKFKTEVRINSQKERISPATKQIVETAKRLFHTVDNEKRTENISPPAEKITIENPFPSAFKNSYWWKENGNIYGVANLNGVKHKVTAVPAKCNRNFPAARTMLSNDGKRYFLRLEKM